MDINFPLILLFLVVISGVIWSFDRFVLSKKRSKDEPVPGWIEYSGSFFPVLLLVFVLRSFLFEPFQIPSGSMIPTLKVGDFILVNKFTYGIRLPVIGTKIIPINEPMRGDVMVFFPPEDDRYFIKRVVGLPGDEIRLRDNILYINGLLSNQVSLPESAEDSRFELVSEDLNGVVHSVQKNKIAGPLGKNYVITVPDNHYFMMGDNRDNSSDSRVWGPVPEENIVGKAVLIWMYWESFGELPSFDRTGKIN
ncbi:signal peptidase I [Porticoccus sp.]|uniref:signal peptidase I n=1 Tax=Porticoccus sp. TaxID=2024853 RepID=UPI003F697FD1